MAARHHHRYSMDKGDKMKVRYCIECGVPLLEDEYMICAECIAYQKALELEQNIAEEEAK